MKAHSATLALAMMLSVAAGCQDKNAVASQQAQNGTQSSAASDASQTQTATADKPTEQQDARFHQGQQLVKDANCMRCHTDTSRPFGPEYTKLGSFSALKAQVEACNTNLGTGWFPEEVEAAAYYLNKKYYRFSQ